MSESFTCIKVGDTFYPLKNDDFRYDVSFWMVFLGILISIYRGIV
nr:MAG TPA: hypothetical protein [Caudoviricetes sp.]